MVADDEEEEEEQEDGFMVSSINTGTHSTVIQCQWNEVEMCGCAVLVQAITRRDHDDVDEWTEADAKVKALSSSPSCLLLAACCLLRMVDGWLVC